MTPFTARFGLPTNLYFLRRSRKPGESTLSRFNTQGSRLQRLDAISPKSFIAAVEGFWWDVTGQETIEIAADETRSTRAPFNYTFTNLFLGLYMSRLPFTTDLRLWVGRRQACLGTRLHFGLCACLDCEKERSVYVQYAATAKGEAWRA